MNHKPYEPQTYIDHFNKKQPPHTLYHYTGQAGLIGIIGAAELWATKIQYMNDATEFGLALRLARETLDHLTSNSTPSERNACVQLKRSLEGLEDINIFAVCFCEHGDLLSQWRGYAGNSSGYAIGFDPDALMQIADRNHFALGRCIYDQDVQSRIIQEAITHCIENESTPLTSGRRWGFHGPLADILFRCGAFFKDKSFEEEKEWRLVSPTIRYDNERLRFRVGNSMMTPFFGLPIKNDGALPIPHVVVGPCPHTELAKFAVTSLLMRNGVTAPLNGQQVALESAIPFRNW